MEDFVSLDPLSEGLNWYQYTANPIKNIDPTGKYTLQCTRIIQTGKYCTITTTTCYDPCTGFTSCRSYYTINRKYRNDYRRLEKCGITGWAFCTSLESPSVEGGGDRCNVAQRMGVDSKCLCALAMTEMSFRNLLTDLQDFLCALTGGWTIGRSPEPTVGCMQISVGTARECLRKLYKCDQKLYHQIAPPSSDGELRYKLSTDCNFSMKIAAACAKVNTDPKCIKNHMTCDNWAKTRWNPSNRKFQDRLKCMLEEVKNLNICN